jgi:hypothetical protein
VFGELWRARATLSETARETFDQALLAYFGAIEVRDRQPTISVVAAIAALNMLASSFAEECPELLVCPRHGPLGFKHRTRGDAAAITHLTCDLLGLADGGNDARKVKTLVRRVYSEQRSAYVHGAELRHGEYGAARAPEATIRPAADGQYTRLAQYADDAGSILDLTRRVLISWLMRATGVTIDVRQFDRGPGIIRVRTEEAGFSSPARVESNLRIVPWRLGELEELQARDEAREGRTVGEPSS